MKRARHLTRPPGSGSIPRTQGGRKAASSDLKAIGGLVLIDPYTGTYSIQMCGFLPLSKRLFEPLRYRLLSLGSNMQRRDFITLVGGAACIAGKSTASFSRPRLSSLS